MFCPMRDPGRNINRDPGGFTFVQMDKECLTKQKAILPDSHPHMLSSKCQLDMIKAMMMTM